MNPAYKPMLATLVDERFDGKKWVFETKWDGLRLITEKRKRAVVEFLEFAGALGFDPRSAIRRIFAVKAKR